MTTSPIWTYPPLSHLRQRSAYVPKMPNSAPFYDLKIKQLLHTLGDIDVVKIRGKWNKIEHRMFCHITQNWRGRPLVSRAVVVNLIANTTTGAGLAIQAALDLHSYKTGVKVSDEELAKVKLMKDRFHGEWNYTISPR